jgi:hypothetical protein
LDEDEDNVGDHSNDAESVNVLLTTADILPFAPLMTVLDFVIVCGCELLRLGEASCDEVGVIDVDGETENDLDNVLLLLGVSLTVPESCCEGVAEVDVVTSRDILRMDDVPLGVGLVSRLDDIVNEIVPEWRVGESSGVLVSETVGEGGAAVDEWVPLGDRDSVVVFDGEGTGESVTVPCELIVAVGTDGLRSVLSVDDIDPETDWLSEESLVNDWNETVRLAEISLVSDGTLFVCAVTYVLVPMEGVTEADRMLDMLSVGVRSFVSDDVGLMLYDRLSSPVGVSDGERVDVGVNEPRLMVTDAETLISSVVVGDRECVATVSSSDGDNVSVLLGVSDTVGDSVRVGGLDTVDDGETDWTGESENEGDGENDLDGDWMCVTVDDEEGLLDTLHDHVTVELVLCRVPDGERDEEVDDERVDVSSRDSVDDASAVWEPVSDGEGGVVLDTWCTVPEPYDCVGSDGVAVTLGDALGIGEAETVLSRVLE